MSTFGPNNSSRSSSRQSKASSTVPRYRKKANHSQIDEMLFGSSPTSTRNSNRNCNPESSMPQEEFLHFTENSKKTLPKPGKVNPKSRKPETLRVVTKDLIRDVVVPADDPQSRKAFVDRNMYEYLSWKATTKEATVDEIKRAEDIRRDQIQKGMQERKAVLQAYDQKRMQNKPKNDLEQEAEEQQEEQIERYRLQKLEQDDEIRHLNELILEAKCHAIRDAQINEKYSIAKELQVENDRLDAMMEVDRIAALRQQEEVARLRKARRQRGAAMIMDQIKTNETEKLLEKDRRDNEATVMQVNQQKLQLQDLAEIETRKLQQQQMQQEIEIINKATQEAKQLRLEQDRIAEERVYAYQKAKEKRERELEEEEARKRLEKELETAKLRKAQERASDLQAEKDALRAKRHEEHTEREYRRKVREEAAKKAVVEAEMAFAREEQIQAKRHLSAVQAARERAEFDKDKRESQKEIEKMEALSEVRQMNLRKYSEDVKNQIAERESQRISDRKAFFEETITKNKELEETNKRLKDVKLGKLQALHESGVPEKYVHEVARRIGI